jgi:hypothetical protein
MRQLRHSASMVYSFQGIPDPFRRQDISVFEIENDVNSELFFDARSNPSINVLIKLDNMK